MILFTMREIRRKPSMENIESLERQKVKNLMKNIFRILNFYSLQRTKKLAGGRSMKIVENYFSATENR